MKKEIDASNKNEDVYKQNKVENSFYRKEYLSENNNRNKIDNSKPKVIVICGPTASRKNCLIY